MRRLSTASLCLAVLSLACMGTPEEDPGLTAEQLARYVRSDVKEPLAWATDVREALVLAGQKPDADHACQVFATIEQESGYEADPAVPGLADIVMTELEAEVRDMLGFLGPKALELVIDVGPEGQPTFRERLQGVRTERELDLVFRDLVDFHGEHAPLVAGALRALFPKLEERLNPISTAGSMQVQVIWSQQHEVSAGMDRDAVRDLLYTREGGIRYGTLRLFDHDAAYDDPIYRFADFNAGQYASRNAAFQAALAKVTGTELAPDGDLLIYNKRGKPTDQVGQTMGAVLAWRVDKAPELEEAAVWRQVKKEKKQAFERTEVWSRVRADYAALTGKEAPYARVPDVSLDSPKLKGDWSTATFAERVKKRYTDCLKRG